MTSTIQQLRPRPLAAIPLLIGRIGLVSLIGLGGCSPCGAFGVFQGACERVCCEVADKVDACDQVTYADLDALDRDDFVQSCTDGWTRTSADLTAYELQEATESCRFVRDRVKDLDVSASGGGCAELAAIYADTDLPDPDE